MNMISKNALYSSIFWPLKKQDVWVWVYRDNRLKVRDEGVWFIGKAIKVFLSKETTAWIGGGV